MTRSPRRSPAALALVVALVLAFGVAGCGGGGAAPRGGGAAQVKSVLKRAFADLANGDGTDFCSLTTPDGRAKLAADLPSYTCARIVALVAQRLPAAVKTGLRHVEIRAVTVDGGQAVVRDADVTASRGSLAGVVDAGSATHLTRQANGSWKISG